jgi:hypothetical protein
LPNPPEETIFFWDLRKYREDEFSEDEEEESSSILQKPLRAWRISAKKIQS